MQDAQMGFLEYLQKIVPEELNNQKLACSIRKHLIQHLRNLE